MSILRDRQNVGVRLAEALRTQMDQAPGYSPGLVSRLSGVPKATIVNWLEGRVNRPRRWQDLLRVADAMRLTRDRADVLLTAAGYPSLADLVGTADQQDVTLFTPWMMSVGSLRSRPVPLPCVATPFLGRDVERAALSHLVTDGGVRVVTLTGIAGVGKTRLALEVAGSVAERFRDGVAFVGLAPLTDAALVAEHIAHALGVGGGWPAILDGAVDAADQLVVLDNFEHVLAALPVVSDLVARAPGLTFLVTSRVVLHLYGEHQFEVVPLPVPDEDDADAESLASSPAVALFAQRAQGVHGSFRLDEDNGEVIAEICRRLDGLPLAIELAAARTAVLQPTNLLKRLAGRLGLLTWGAGDLPPRHQSLQAAFDWSLELLDDASRRLFAQLSVFMSGCRLDGAEAVAAPSDVDDVLDSLMALVDHSLVRTISIGRETRFVMLESVRSYAATLLSADESQMAHTAAVRFAVDLAQTVEREVHGPLRADLLDRVSEELDNLRALLRWSFDHERAAEGATIASSLLPFWLRHRPLTEGQRWLDLALRDTMRLPSPVLAATLFAAGSMAYERDDLASAERRMRDSLVVYDRLHDEDGRTRVLAALGALARDRRDVDSEV